MNVEDLPEWAAGFTENGSAPHGALDDIAALRDRARSPRHELTTRLAEETRRRLHTVSVVTTLFLPATFVTGCFGMDTSGLRGLAKDRRMARFSPPSSLVSPSFPLTAAAGDAAAVKQRFSRRGNS